MSHTTHFDDCGCLTARYEARIATLEAELAEAQQAATFGTPLVVDAYKAELAGVRLASATELAFAYAHANALRDALAIIHDGHGGGAAFIAGEALAQTPAASLAALKAEVLELAAKACEGAGDDDDWGPFFAGRIRALAAQAATRTEERWECPTCGLGVSADEDGCCATCGADCTTKPATVTIQAREVTK